MPPRIRLRSLAQLALPQLLRPSYLCRRCQYATITAVTPPPSHAQMTTPIAQFGRYSPEQPPSHRDPKQRKSQLLRSYVSLLQSTPLMLLFQHNNLKSVEWIGIRRELARAMQKLDDQLLAQGADPSTVVGRFVKIQIIKTNIFEPALRVAEYYKPSLQPPKELEMAAGIQSEKDDPALTHALSEAAYQEAMKHRNIHPLTPLLSGSVALLTFPSVSPQYLKAALSILSPQQPHYPAPTRRLNPSYHELPVQEGLKKLLLLGARIEGKVFDLDGTRWVGSIDGGMDGLRAQLVAILQGFGAGLTNTLESAGRNLWFTVEGRRTILEQEHAPAEGERKD